MPRLEPQLCDLERITQPLCAGHVEGPPHLLAVSSQWVTWAGDGVATPPDCGARARLGHKDPRAAVVSNLQCKREGTPRITPAGLG